MYFTTAPELGMGLGVRHWAFVMHMDVETPGILQNMSQRWKKTLKCCVGWLPSPPFGSPLFVAPFGCLGCPPPVVVSVLGCAAGATDCTAGGRSQDKQAVVHSWVAGSISKPLLGR